MTQARRRLEASAAEEEALRQRAEQQAADIASQNHAIKDLQSQVCRASLNAKVGFCDSSHAMFSISKLARNLWYICPMRLPALHILPDEPAGVASLFLYAIGHALCWAQQWKCLQQLFQVACFL